MPGKNANPQPVRLNHIYFLIATLNPLREKYCDIALVDEDSRRDVAVELNRVRVAALQTIDLPLETAALDVPLQIRELLILRHFVRTHGFSNQDGRGLRPFWKKLDEFYVGMKEMYGERFEDPRWHEFLVEVIRQEERLDHERPPVQTPVLKPLFTTEPLQVNRPLGLN